MLTTHSSIMALSHPTTGASPCHRHRTHDKHNSKRSNQFPLPSFILLPFSFSYRQSILAVNDRRPGGFAQLFDQCHVWLPRRHSFVGHAEGADGNAAVRTTQSKNSLAANPGDHLRQGHWRTTSCVRCAVARSAVPGAGAGCPWHAR